jgi:hypothetical protein
MVVVAAYLVKKPCEPRSAAAACLLARVLGANDIIHPERRIAFAGIAWTAGGPISPAEPLQVNTRETPRLLSLIPGVTPIAREAASGGRNA